jgi:nucleoside-diphosphate-sugar epimerase
MPLTYIDNCADAVVAALAPGAVGATLNVVDDERPSSRAFLAAINALPVGGGRSIVAMPMALLRLAAVVCSGINRTLFRGRLPLPGWLVPERVDARFKPLRYANAQAKALLGWRPAVPLTEALSRSV